MNTLTLSEVQARLADVMDDVCAGHAPTVITRDNGEHVVMLSLSDFNSIQETMHLLGSAKNASRLAESILQIKMGKARPKDLIRSGRRGGRK